MDGTRIAMVIQYPAASGEGSLAAALINPQVDQVTVTIAAELSVKVCGDDRPR